MCTIIVLRDVRADLPLVVAANRDEMYARAATPPRVLLDAPRVVGGQDCERGGTWMGVTERRFFAAITNQRTYFPADRALSSRGKVVLGALAAGSVDRVDALVRALDADAYNPFNLLYGDLTALHVAYVRREPGSIEIAALDAGLHVLTNDRIGSPEFPKALRAEALVKPHLAAPWPELRDALVRTLSDHAVPDLDAVRPPPPGSPMDLGFAQKLQAICVHTPLYGTHSSTLLAFGPGGLVEYRFANGPPCVTAYVDVAT